jgi:hypothetical protein
LHMLMVKHEGLVSGFIAAGPLAMLDPSPTCRTPLDFNSNLNLSPEHKSHTFPVQTNNRSLPVRLELP